MSDLASFDGKLLMRIYGEFPVCIAEECNKRACDFHHVTRHGNAKNKEDRKLHSSILNCAPLCREHHTEGKLHHRETEEFYLRTIRYVLSELGYEMNANDGKFMEKYSAFYQHIS